MELEAKWIKRYDSWFQGLGKTAMYLKGNTTFIREHITGDSWVVENKVDKSDQKDKITVN